MTSPAAIALPKARRQRLHSAFCILHSAFLFLSSCSALHGPLDSGSDDVTDMQPHPRRPEMPSVIGPESVRVHSGKFPVIQFSSDDWRLSSGESAKIRAVAQWLNAHPERVLVAAGARAESPEYSRQLSDLRAQTVRQALITAGVPEEKVLTVSFGEDAPPATGNGVSFSIINTGDSR